MKFHLEQIKANDKFHGICLDFVDSGFVKTCDELVIGQPCQRPQGAHRRVHQRQLPV